MNATRNTMKLIFAGTPEFARRALERLIAAGHDVALVLTQPDRPAGRGMKLQASPVKQCALQQGIAVAQPQSLRLDGKYPEAAHAARAEIETVQADVMVVAAYGLILPQWALDTPRWGCLNIHASLLPRWRGAAPIHRAIEAGDSDSGITIMQMDAGLDTGDMLLCQRLPIMAQDTTATLHDRLADLGGELIVQALQQLHPTHGMGLMRQPQPQSIDIEGEGTGITYAHKIDKAESAIDWTQSASVLARRIRAFDPFPAASAYIESETAKETVKIWSATVSDWPRTDPDDVPCGQIVFINETGIGVACGVGVLTLTQLQRAGGKRLAAADFLRGFVLRPGMVWRSGR